MRAQRVQSLSPWPPGFVAVPDEDWMRSPVDAFAKGYDGLGRHGWYANLDPTVDRLADFVRDGYVVVDYSGGTGLLADRLFERLPDRSFGLLNVDASAKFLRLAADKHGDEPRAAFRLLRFLPEFRRLQAVDEVLGLELLRGVAAVVCANAIHLYPELDETMAGWRRILRPYGRLFIQSGNIRDPARERTPDAAWTIDDTVHAIAKAARQIVREDDRFAAYRAAESDAVRMEAHDALRGRYFLPLRPLAEYTAALERNGFTIDKVEEQRLDVRVDEWITFLDVYNEGILGWVGGSPKVEGTAPSKQAVADRSRLLAAAAQRVLGTGSFTAAWCHIDATRSPR